MSLDNDRLENLMDKVSNRVDDRHISIRDLVARYVKLVQSPNDLVIIGPILNSLLQVDVKNDEHLVKIAAIIQRGIISLSKLEDDTVDEEDRYEWIKELKDEGNKIS